MPDAIFIGFNDYGWGSRSEPLIAFKTVDEAVKWKNENVDRVFILVELR